jgi:hypothetical protein
LVDETDSYHFGERRGVSFETDPIVTTYQRIRVRVRNDTDAEVQLTGAIVGKVYE